MAGQKEGKKGNGAEKASADFVHAATNGAQQVREVKVSSKFRIIYSTSWAKQHRHKCSVEM